MMFGRVTTRIGWPEALLLLALMLRTTGIWYGLPGMFNSDEPFNVVNALAYGAKSSLEPTYFVYPAFYSYMLLAAYGLFFVAGRLTGVFSSAIDFGAQYFLDPTGLFLVGRALSVLFGVATVWVVYRLARAQFNESVGRLAAALLGVSFVHVDLSHWILPEAAVTLLSGLALLATWRATQAADWRATALAGLICGLAISTKYNAGFLALPLFLGQVLRHRGSWPHLLRGATLAAASLVVGFLVGSPYWLLAFARYWRELQYTLAHVDAGMIGHITAVPLVWPVIELIRSDWTVGVVFVLGLLWATVQRDRRAWLFIAFVWPTLLFVGSWQRTGVHYLAPLLPALAILGAWALDEMVLRGTGSGTRWRTVLLAAIFVAPAMKVGLYDIRLCRPDTRTLAKNWIESNLPEQSTIAYENYVYGPNLFDPNRYLRNESESRLLPPALRARLQQAAARRKTYDLVNLRKDQRLQRARTRAADEGNPYEAQLLSTLLPHPKSLRDAGVQYLIASSDNYERYFSSVTPAHDTALWRSFENGQRFYGPILAGAGVRLLKQFQPSFWNLGPEIRIYEIDGR